MQRFEVGYKGFQTKNPRRGGKKSFYDKYFYSKHLDAKPLKIRKIFIPNEKLSVQTKKGYAEYHNVFSWWDSNGIQIPYLSFLSLLPVTNHYLLAKKRMIHV